MAHPRCPPTMFDGEGKTWKASRTIKLLDSGAAKVHRIGRRYWLCVEPPPAQRNSRLEQWRQAESAKKALQSAQSTLRRMPTTVCAYRASAMKFAESLEGMFGDVVAGTFTSLHGGYPLDIDARNSVGIHLQAVRCLIETAPVVLNRDARRAAVDRIMAPARQSNPALTAMLGSIEGSGPSLPASDNWAP